MALTPSEIFDQALELLLPVRQQVNQGAVDFNFARKQLADGEQLLTQLPDASQLRERPARCRRGPAPVGARGVMG